MVTVEAEGLCHFADVAVGGVAFEVGGHIDAVASARAVLNVGQTDAGADAVAQCDVGELLVLLLFRDSGFGCRSGLFGGRGVRVGFGRLRGRGLGVCRGLGLQGSFRVQGNDNVVIAGGSGVGGCVSALSQCGDAEHRDQQQGGDGQTCKTLVHGRKILS